MAIPTLRSMLSALRDPSTEQATAWWAFLAAALWDSFAHGLHWENGVFLLTLAGLRVVAAGGPPAPPEP
ncbi:MAG TPA: hypothetical protein VFF77_04945, partial [Holophagaceae bacterium]|nr:hypothetical protein [Holophagaceae bacterium]